MGVVVVVGVVAVVVVVAVVYSSSSCNTCSRNSSRSSRSSSNSSSSRSSSSSSGRRSSSSSCCCCWQPLRLPPRGVVRFLCWHVLKLEFWHFAHPELNFAFAFASVFAVFYSKKVSQPPGCTVQKRVDLCISHRFFRCFPVCVAFCIGFYSIFADSRLSAHAGLDLRFSFSSVWGVEG